MITKERKEEIKEAAVKNAAKYRNSDDMPSSLYTGFCDGAVWSDEHIDENSIVKWLRNQTGCGLMDGKDAINKLIFALRHHPSVIMDNPLKMEIIWKYKNNED